MVITNPNTADTIPSSRVERIAKCSGRCGSDGGPVNRRLTFTCPRPSRAGQHAAHFGTSGPRGGGGGVGDCCGGGGNPGYSGGVPPGGGGGCPPPYICCWYACCQYCCAYKSRIACTAPPPRSAWISHSSSRPNSAIGRTRKHAPTGGDRASTSISTTCARRNR